MYKTDNGQISLAEFYSPFGKLDSNNRWARIADMIPWERYETKYAEQFCADNGAPAISFRMAFGTLIIKQRTGHSDEETLQDIVENPYMQYLIGLHEFTTEAPFSVSSITNFRKYITEKMIKEINEELFVPKKENEESNNDKDDKNDNHSNDGGASNNNDDKESVSELTITVYDANGNIVATATSAEENVEPINSLPPPENEGKLLLDATCAPANIAYPTDASLLNEAREKLEEIIDTLHPHTNAKKKPRTYRDIARRQMINFIKNRKPSKKVIRKIIGKQLRFVARDLKYIDNQLETTGMEPLSNLQQRDLETIRILYEQQQNMYDTRTHSIPHRIVSISQPHVRPIVRGKTNAPVEFGAKISISLIDGYAFIDKLDWEAYNESELLIQAVETYRQRYGCYPEAVLADQIYRNRGNRAFCKERNIRLSGPKLGKPAQATRNTDLKQERQDASQRNAVEGKFGEGKTKYGLDRIMARLKETSETVISMSFLCMNLSRRLRVLLRFFINFYFDYTEGWKNSKNGVFV